MNARERIRTLMADQGITQIELCEKVGMTKAALNKTLTRSNNDLLFSTYKKLLNALGYTIKVVKKK